MPRKDTPTPNQGASPPTCLFVVCPRCRSEVYTEGMHWPDPRDHEPGDVVRRWVSCPVEADGGGDPMGEWDDGEPCGEDLLVQRRVSSSGDAWTGRPVNAEDEP